MAQTIDLRKKDAPLVVPKPVESQPAIEPVAEPVAEEEIIPEPTLPETSDISWLTYLSPPHRKGQTLYITFILIISAGLVAYFLHDFLFTTVLVLSVIVLNLNATRPHRQSEITVHATGVSIDDQRHHFADMKSFWVEYQPNLKELSIEMKKGYSQKLKIPLEDTDPVQIRRTMLTYIPEKEHEQSLLDHIVRLIGI